MHCDKNTCLHVETSWFSMRLMSLMSLSAANRALCAVDVFFHRWGYADRSTRQSRVSASACETVQHKTMLACGNNIV